MNSVVKLSGEVLSPQKSKSQSQFIEQLRANNPAPLIEPNQNNGISAFFKSVKKDLDKLENAFEEDIEENPNESATEAGHYS